VQLVLQASVFVQGGELFMLEMGEPINIKDLAERMIRLSGRKVGTDIAIRIDGIRPGEKLTEELCVPEEGAEPTNHPQILRLHPIGLPVDVIEPAIANLTRLAEQQRHDDVSCALFELVGTASHDSELVDLANMERSRW
jgi:FlaA1/EpsC-like NDP-sugar epimerase